MSTGRQLELGVVSEEELREAHAAVRCEQSFEAAMQWEPLRVCLERYARVRARSKASWKVRRADRRRGGR